MIFEGTKNQFFFGLELTRAGKSVPDQASLILIYQYLDIKDNEKKQLSKLIFNKQNIRMVYFF